MQPPEVFYKIAVLKSFAIFTGRHLCWGSQEKTCVETPKQVFFCECCKIFKNTYFEEKLRTFASVLACVNPNMAGDLVHPNDLKLGTKVYTNNDF